jgi:hypothetical protein
MSGPGSYGPDGDTDVERSDHGTGRVLLVEFLLFSQCKCGWCLTDLSAPVVLRRAPYQVPAVLRAGQRGFVPHLSTLIHSYQVPAVLRAGQRGLVPHLSTLIHTYQVPAVLRAGQR